MCAVVRDGGGLVFAECVCMCVLVIFRGVIVCLF